MEELEGMSLEKAQDLVITGMAQAHKGKITESKRFFKAMRVINMNRAREIYETLSKEFIRKGIGSNRFSELEELYNIADVSIRDHEAQQAKIDKLEAENKELVEALEFVVTWYANGEVGDKAKQVLAKIKREVSDE